MGRRRRRPIRHVLGPSGLIAHAVVRSRATPRPDPAGPPRADGGRSAVLSVMIPTLPATELLEKTLRCVLDQDPGPDRMQIAVVNDRSPDGAGRRIVGRLAPGRVEFHRSPTNVGLARNWNSCIERSPGPLGPHPPPGRPGPPRLLRAAGAARTRAGPEVGAAFCRHALHRRRGPTDRRVAPIERPTAGVLDGWLEKIAREQLHPVPVDRRPARRSTSGSAGFRTDLCYRPRLGDVGPDRRPVPVLVRAGDPGLLPDPRGQRDGPPEASRAATWPTSGGRSGSSRGASRPRSGSTWAATCSRGSGATS